MRIPVSRVFVALIPMLVVLGYYQFFYDPKLSDEDAHITTLIEKLPEYNELMKKNDAKVHIDFPRQTDSNLVMANILTFRLNGDPAKLVYRLTYDKHADTLISMEKE